MNRYISLVVERKYWVLTALCFILLAIAIQKKHFNGYDRSDVNPKLSPVQSTEKLRNHSKTFDTPKVVKVTDGVYLAIGYTLANMIMLEGSDGIVIVDTTESTVQATNILKEFRQITKKPLKGIIMTHFHVDHVTGAQAIIEESEKTGLADSDGINVYAHSTLDSQIRRFMSTAEVGNMRARRQFGARLKADVERINSGIGPHLIQEEPVQVNVPKPTHTFDDEMEFELAGLKFHLIHTPGETDDQITVWLPQEKIVLPADNIYKTFPNLYAIRGSPTRDANRWVKSLDRVRELEAEIMVPSHTEAVHGRMEIEEILQHYRDGIQYVHDQTVRWINNGLTPDEIVLRVNLPDKLRRHPYLQEFYGMVPWSVRGIYQSHLGWFDGKPENLMPLNQKERFEKWNRLLKRGSAGADGNARIVADAERSLHLSMENLKSNNVHLNAELQWALELSSGVMEITDPDDLLHIRAKGAKIKAIRELASTYSNANGRNYLLTCANELEGLDITTSQLTIDNSKMQLSIDIIMENFKYYLKAEECNENDVLTVVFNLTDIERTFSYKLRNCVFEYRTDPSPCHPDPDAKLTLTSALWRTIMTKEVGFLSSYMSGDLVLEGSLLSLQKFIGLNEKA